MPGFTARSGGLALAFFMRQPRRLNIADMGWQCSRSAAPFSANS